MTAQRWWLWVLAGVVTAVPAVGVGVAPQWWHRRAEDVLDWLGTWLARAVPGNPQRGPWSYGGLA
jgi:hypothetical protein